MSKKLSKDREESLPGTNQMIQTIIKIYVGIVIIIALPTLLLGQQQFKPSKTATIIINAVLNDSSVMATSREVSIYMDNSYSDINIMFEKSTLRTNIDSLNTKLKELTNDYVQFEGSFERNLTDTELIPEDPIILTGQLSCKEECKKLVGMAKFEKLNSGIYTYNLHLSLSFDYKDINYPIDLEGLEPDIRVDIFQPVMNLK